MKMKKIVKIMVSVLLAALMLLSAACVKPTTPDPTDAPTDAPTAEPTPEPTPEPVSIEKIIADLPTLQYGEIKNVILFIGDGMGIYHTPATDAIQGGTLNGKMLFEYFTAFNTVDTTCLEGEPDSASGGTAYATGYKSNRKFVGLDYKKNEVQNVVELAHSLGKSTGVLTSESIVDATPATFTVHTANRNDEENVAALEIAANAADMIIGGGKAAYEALMANKPETADALKANNVTWVKTWEDAQKFDGNGRLIATMTDDFWEEAEKMVPTMAEMTQFAIDRLSQNEKGFFLMVENGAMDEIAHSGDVMEMTRHMMEMDKAIEVALRYVYEHKDTIIILTADHDTGGLKPREEADTYIEKNKKSNQFIADEKWCLANASLHCLLEAEKIAMEKNPTVDYDTLPYRFTTIAHTTNKVNIWAIGPGTEQLADASKLKSFEIGKFIGKAISGQEFGAADKSGKK